MRLSDFILLSNDQKRKTVYRCGQPLAKSTQGDRTVFLFQLRDYYVEAVCNPQNKAIEEYRVFRDSALLQPYLEAISLDGLLPQS